MDGVRSIIGNNRFWIIENMLSPKMTEYRKAIYRYHRLGLDAMATDPATGQSEILASLNQIDQARSLVSQYNGPADVCGDEIRRNR